MFPEQSVDPATSLWRSVRPVDSPSAAVGRLARVRIRHLHHHPKCGRSALLSRRTRQKLRGIGQVPKAKASKGKGDPMEIPVDNVGDVAVAAVPVEELDASKAGEFKRDIAPVLQSHTKLVLDLSQLRFVDSSGLGAMLSCLRQLTARGGDLKLCSLSKQVRALFELVRMHRIFDIYGTREEAARAFQA